jgi:hypothetical protein
LLNVAVTVSDGAGISPQKLTPRGAAVPLAVEESASAVARAGETGNRFSNEPSAAGTMRVIWNDLNTTGAIIHVPSEIVMGIDILPAPAASVTALIIYSYLISPGANGWTGTQKKPFHEFFSYL